MYPKNGVELLGRKKTFFTKNRGFRAFHSILLRKLRKTEKKSFAVNSQNRQKPCQQRDCGQPRPALWACVPGRPPTEKTEKK